MVSRCYLTASFLTTAACALELVSPFSLYFNFGLIFYKGQVRPPALMRRAFAPSSARARQACVATPTLSTRYPALALQLWRIVTNFLFFGVFSLDFLFHLYFLVSLRPGWLTPRPLSQVCRLSLAPLSRPLTRPDSRPPPPCACKVRYCWYLEESSRFRGRTGEFLWMLFLGASAMTALAPFISVRAAAPALGLSPEQGFRAPLRLEPSALQGPFLSHAQTSTPAVARWDHMKAPFEWRGAGP